MREEEEKKRREWEENQREETRNYLKKLDDLDEMVFQICNTGTLLLKLCCTSESAAAETLSGGEL